MRIGVETIARVYIEAKRALFIATNDFAPGRKMAQAEEEIRFLIDLGPAATPERLHEFWLARKRRNGWSWGIRRDFQLRTHDRMVPWEDLPEIHQAKYRLLVAVVAALAPAECGGSEAGSFVSEARA